MDRSAHVVPRPADVLYREDLDRPHDHPWQFWSLILRGGYAEELHARPGNTEFVVRQRRHGRAHRFPLHHAHRITAVSPRTVTLVLVGRKVRSWGFFEGSTWIDYRDALNLRSAEGNPAKRLKTAAAASSVTNKLTGVAR